MTKVRFLHFNSNLVSIRLVKPNIVELNLFIRENDEDHLVSQKAIVYKNPFSALTAFYKLK